MIAANYNDYADGGSHKDFEISIVGEQTVIDNSKMLSESIKLQEALCSEQNLRFGACEASQFTVQVANTAGNFKGKTLEVAVTMDEATTKYGTFKVQSDKPTADRIWRVLTAYDTMYDIINADVLEWYSSLTFPMTLANFRNSFFTYLGVTQKSTTLINDSFVIQGGFTATGALSGKTIINAICEFNGVFGHINRDGDFEYISLDGADSFNCPPYENNSVTYEDYVTEAITKVTMKGSSDDVGTSVGTDGNEYIIINNPLIYGTEGTQALITALTNLLNKISLVTYRPYSLNKTIGNPCVELGDAIVISTKYQTINSYVIKRVLSGIQALRDNYSATGDKTYPKEVNTIQSQINRIAGKTSELSYTVDGLSSTVTSVQQTANTALTRANGSITTDTLHYLATPLSSGVTTETAGWTTTPQSMTTTNKYLWTYHTYTYADAHTSDTTPVITGVYGEDGQQGQTGPAGQDGTSVTITSQSVTYQEGTSGTTAPSGTWSTTVPTVANGNYLWTKTVVNYSNNTSTTSYSVARQGQNGQNGQDGQDGQDGTSVTVSSIQYASSASGTTAPSSGWQNTIPTVAQGSYLWTKTTYSNGSVAYTNSRQGVNGSNGTSVTISSQSVTYQVSNSGTTVPSGTWSSTPQTTTAGQYLWTRTIVNYSTGNSTTSYSVSAHGQNGQNGANGISITSVTSLYYASGSSTAPSAPSSEVTTTSTSVYNTWTKGVPALTSTYNKLYTCDQVKYSNNTFTWTTPVLQNAITTAVSEIQQLAGQIVLKVKSDGTVAKVELGADASTGSNVLIKGDNIQLDGNVHITSGFALSIGTVGGFDVDGTSISTGETIISSEDFSKTIKGVTVNGLRFAMGNDFAINNNGVVYAQSINLRDESDSTYKYYNSLNTSSLNLNYYEGNYIKSVVATISGGTPDIALRQVKNNQGLILEKEIRLTTTDITKTDGTNTYTYIHTGNIGSQSVANATYAVSLRNKDASDKNSVNGNGWYSVAESANNVSPGGNYHCLAVNWYWGIDMRTGDVNWLRINGNIIVSAGNYASIIKNTLNINSNAGYMIGSHSGLLDLGSAACVLCGDSGSFVRKNTNRNTANVIHASQFAVDSSRLIKENVQNITEEYAKNILKLRPVSFDYIEKVGGQKGQCGMIAEEVLPIFPECVNVPDGYTEEKAIEEIANGNNMMCLSLDYAKFTPYLIKMIQMQQQQINELKSLIKTEE